MTFDNTITIGEDDLKTYEFVIRPEYSFNNSPYHLVGIKLTKTSDSKAWGNDAYIAGELVYKDLINPENTVIAEFCTFYNDFGVIRQHMVAYVKDSDKFAYDIVFSSDGLNDPVVLVKSTLNYSVEDLMP